MKTMLYVCLLAGVLAAVERPAIEGKWEGQVNGLKAITLTLHVTNGIVEGSVIFYVTRDTGKGPRIVDQDERKILTAKWDGKTLRFGVGAPDFDPEAPGVRLTLTLSGDRKAELNVLGEHESTLTLTRVE